MEPPALSRRGESQRISKAFSDAFGGKLTSIDSVSALRQRLLLLCVDGSGGFDSGMLAALKSHVSLREALEIEAIKCLAGDHRHDFQEWYPKDAERRRKQGTDLSGALNPASLLDEMQMTRQAIDEHERLLTEHRAAVLADTPSPLRQQDVDAIHNILASLRSTLPVIEAEYARLVSPNPNPSTATGADARGMGTG